MVSEGLMRASHSSRGPMQRRAVDVLAHTGWDSALSGIALAKLWIYSVSGGAGKKPRPARPARTLELAHIFLSTDSLFNFLFSHHTRFTSNDIDSSIGFRHNFLPAVEYPTAFNIRTILWNATLKFASLNHR